MFARKGKQNKRKPTNKAHNKASAGKVEDSHSGGTFKFRCHRCRQIGHKAIDCPEKSERNTKGPESKEKAAIGEDIAFLTSHVNVNSCFTENTREKDAWCLDSGCTSHLCHDRRKFERISSTGNLKLNLANHDSTDVKARGTVKIVAAGRGTTKNLHLENALHVPDLRSNLISIAKITDAENSVEFFKKKAVIKNSRGTTILVADRKGDLYYLRESDEESARNITAETHKSPLIVWHERFGHLNWRDLLEMSKKEAVLGLHLKSDGTTATCEVCSEAKITALPFGKNSHRCDQPLDKIHADVCGPMRNESRRKTKYFLTFTDDHSRWTEIRFLRNKSEVLSRSILQGV